MDYLEENPNEQFSQIFAEGEYRKIIPYGSDIPEVKNMVKTLNGLGYTVDLGRWLAIKPFKDQLGKDRTQETRLNKVIQRELGEDYLEKFLSSGIRGYSIILSRHPIDIIRMSDFKNIQSCHSEGGSYFNCALNEAKEGGAIAYVIKSKDKENLDLNATEIFEDKNRKIPGITPVSRLRVRKLPYIKENGMEYDLAVPETREYGNPVPGLYKDVKNYLLNKQKDLIENNVIDKTRLSYMGGSYSDHDLSYLLQEFLGESKIQGTGKIKYIGDGEKKSLGAIWEEEIKQYKETLEVGKFKYAYLDYQISEEDYTSVYLIFGFNIDFQNYLKPDSENLFNECFEAISKEFKEYVKRLGFELDEVSLSDGRLNFNFNNDTYLEGPDSYKSIAEDLKENIEDNFTNLYLDIVQILEKYSIFDRIQSFNVDDKLNSFQELNLKNFKIDYQHNQITLTSRSFELPSMTRAFSDILEYKFKDWKKEFTTFLYNKFNYILNSQLNLFHTQENSELSNVDLKAHNIYSEPECYFSFSLTTVEDLEKVEMTYKVVRIIDNLFNEIVKQTQESYQSYMAYKPEQQENMQTAKNKVNWYKLSQARYKQAKASRYKQAQAVMEDQYTFTDEAIDSHHDQIDLIFTMYKNNAKVAYCEYTIYKDKISINYIYVKPELRRQKLGTKLVQELQRQNPDYEILFSSTTDDGHGFVSNLPRTFNENTEYTQLSQEYAELKKQIKEMEQQPYSLFLGAKMNPIHNRIDDLEDELRNMSKGEYKVIL